MNDILNILQDEMGLFVLVAFLLLLVPTSMIYIMIKTKDLKDEANEAPLLNEESPQPLVVQSALQTPPVAVKRKPSKPVKYRLKPKAKKKVKK